jgi:hypothetical protein
MNCRIANCRPLRRPAVLVLDDGPRVGIVLVQRRLDFRIRRSRLTGLAGLTGRRAEAPLLRLPRVEGGSGRGGELGVGGSIL